MKLPFVALLALTTLSLSAQDTISRKQSKSEKKELKRQKINNMIRQAEEGILVYSKQSIFGFQLRTNGYGGFYEYGKMKTNRKTNIYRIDFNETKHQKEEKIPNDGLFFGNPFIYGKINYFYPVTLGFGQQYILGQKGNRNGVAVSAVYNGGLALGLLRPYYIEVFDPAINDNRVIKYSDDNDLFLGNSIVGGAGFGKGWSEIKVKPGLYGKAALRFDYGRFNELVSGIEVGISTEYYFSEVPIMAAQKNRQLFFQGYVSLVFGRRK